ncbi:MAG TPA: glycosyltransferase family 4 protein [Solirubrobacteraceae bacterium]|jgi:glycosyltransferase involved in cell wall biosynthesis|nr:glycosyltransferase family 4 protein [Solirubrobacteraceae bacterium]
MVLFLHHRYRTTGGEERTVEELLWLVREKLGREAELLTRDSRALGRGEAAAGLLRGGLEAGEVAAAVRRTGARIVHAHNLNPTLGWRALAAARAAGARVVLHLHNYRLVCAVGTCYTRGQDCTRCHGANTLPGVRLNCRGTGAEALAYGASLALWQRRLVAQADLVLVPSEFASQRLSRLGAPLGGVAVRILAPVVRDLASGSRAGAGGPVLVAGRLAPEKGIDTAIDACRRAGVELVVAGDGPEAGRLQEQSRGGAVRFAGTLEPGALTELRDRCSLALVPSRAAETFGLAAAEAMARGLPVVATRMGALPELVPDLALCPPGDAGALAEAIQRLRGDEAAGLAGLNRVRESCSPEAVAPRLGELYEQLLA